MALKVFLSLTSTLTSLFPFSLSAPLSLLTPLHRPSHTSACAFSFSPLAPSRFLRPFPRLFLTLGVLNKRVYVQNEDTQEVVEYAWSDATDYTTDNPLYATPFVETNAAASAASLSVSRGKPTLYLWSVGSGGGDVKEDDDTHGSNALPGTALSAATAQGSGGSSYVFFINQQCHLTQSNRGSDGTWHENVDIQIEGNV